MKAVRTPSNRSLNVAKASWLLALAAFASAMAFAAANVRITDKASAVGAAKRYLKARCTAQTPCTFRPEHEGKQWRVWVRLTKLSGANRVPTHYPGGTLILYFDSEGGLLRRLEAD